MYEDKKKKASQERTYNTKPPVATEFLVKTYKRWRMKHESVHIPKDFLGAANWWIEHQEPAFPNETPMATNDSKGNQFWTTPYIERVVAAFRKFLNFNETEKAYVIHHIEHGVAYRGDHLDFYKKVVEQSEIFNRDPEAYKDSARRHLPK